MNRFDRILWRINGIVFLCAAASAGVLCLMAVSDIFGNKAGDQNDATVIKVNPNIHEKEDLQLDDSTVFSRSTVVRMILRASQTSEGLSSGRSYGGEIRNYLFLDCADMSSHWLLDGFGHLIVQTVDLQTPLRGNDPLTVGAFYEIIMSDTNGDGKIDGADKAAVYFADAAGMHLTQLIPPSDKIVAINQITDDEVLVVSQDGHATTATLFSTLGKEIKRTALPIGDEK